MLPCANLVSRKKTCVLLRTLEIIWANRSRLVLKSGRHILQQRAGGPRARQTARCCQRSFLTGHRGTGLVRTQTKKCIPCCGFLQPYALAGGCIKKLSHCTLSATQQEWTNCKTFLWPSLTSILRCFNHSGSGGPERWKRCKCICNPPLCQTNARPTSSSFTCVWRKYLQLQNQWLISCSQLSRGWCCWDPKLTWFRKFRMVEHSLLGKISWNMWWPCVLYVLFGTALCHYDWGLVVRTRDRSLTLIGQRNHRVWLFLRSPITSQTANRI